MTTKKLTTSKAAKAKASAKAKTDTKATTKGTGKNKITVERFDIVLGKAKVAIKKSGDFMITSACLIADLRARVEAGDSPAGNVKWKDWAPREFNLSYSRIKELLIIGAAPDPERALEDMRANKARRQAKSQANRVPASKAKALTGPGDKPGDEPTERTTPFQDTMKAFKRVTETDQVATAKAIAETAGLLTMKPADLKVLRTNATKAEAALKVAQKSVTDLKAAAAKAPDKKSQAFDASEFGDKERSGDRLKGWNQSVKVFGKLVPEDQAAFVAWAAQEIGWKADSEERLLEIPDFLKRK